MKPTKATIVKTAKATAALAAVLAPAAPALAQGDGLSVTVNRQPVSFSGQGPVESGGRVLVPLRGVLEKMGAYVTFDSARREVKAVRNEAQIILPIGSNTAQVDGRTVSLDAPARILNGSTMVPLRFVAEALGAQVNYEPATSTVAIRTGAGGSQDSAALPRPPRTWNSGRRVDAGRMVRGTVLSVLPRQERIVIRAADGTRRDVDLVPGFRVRQRTADGFEMMNLGRVRRGDIVALEMRNGEAQTITVLPDSDMGAL